LVGLFLESIVTALSSVTRLFVQSLASQVKNPRSCLEEAQRQPFSTPLYWP